MDDTTKTKNYDKGPERSRYSRDSEEPVQPYDDPDGKHSKETANGKKYEGPELQKHVKARKSVLGLVDSNDDKPSKVDLLGRKHLVHIIKGIIDRDSKRHLTLALFGRWGSGKSSVIELLADRYQNEPDSSVIVFNAWQNEYSQNMTASLAERVVDALYQSKDLLSQIWLSVKLKWLEGWHRFATSAVLLFVFIVAFVIFLASLGADFDWQAHLKGVTVSVFAILGALHGLARWYFKHPISGKLEEIAKRPDFRQHIGLNHSIRNHLSVLLQAYALKIWPALKHKFGRTAKGKAHKYVIVIDDLDRCSDEKIIQVLETIQLVVDLDNVVVILVVDQEVLINAVATRYQNQRQELNWAEARKTAREYLGKILQVTIALDKPDALQRQQFICKRLFPDSPTPPSDKPFVDINALPKDREPDTSGDAFAVIKQAGNSSEAGQPLEVEYSDEYLTSTAHEMEFFSRCVGTFNIHNARTMIRIHNAITLLKGLHPELSTDEKMLERYIFMAFWLEALCSSPNEQTHHYHQAINPDHPASLPAFWHPIAKLAERTGLYNLTPRERDDLLANIERISLPSSDILREDARPVESQATETV